MQVIFCLAILLISKSASAEKAPNPKQFSNSLGMKFVRIESGQFRMGCGKLPPNSIDEWKSRDWDESPKHQVDITKTFYMSAYEVTNAQFERFDSKHKNLRGKFQVSKVDDAPVTMVTWSQAVEYCKWLSKLEKKTYRLPTEAEWEYACMSGKDDQIQHWTRTHL